MSTPNSADSNNIITLNITKYPQNLVIPSTDEIDNTISFQVTCNSNKNEKLNFTFEGENLNITVPDDLKAELGFNPGETKDISIEINPVADGFGKLTVNVSYLTEVKYISKVQKIREKVPKGRIKKVLSKRALKGSQNVSSFNPKDLVIKMSKQELSSLESQISLKRTKLKHTSDSMPGVILENIDYELMKLAKGYLSFKNIKRAYEMALEISDLSTKVDFYYKLIRSDKKLDYNGILQAINQIENGAEKQRLIRKLALDRVDLDPEQAARMAFLIEDPSVKEETMKDIIGKTVEKDTSIALKLTYLINDIRLKVSVLYGIIKKLNDKKRKSEAVEYLNQIINLLADANEVDLSTNDFFNTEYIDLRDAIYCIAELVSPAQADSIIGNNPNQQLKERLAKDLIKDLYELVEEQKTKLESKMLYSQYYMFNTFNSNLNNYVKDFALIGGNISNNLLNKDFNFNIAFVSLFKFEFSIFPVLDRVYNDLKFNFNKSIAYYVYPSIDKHKAGELEIINNTLKQFLISCCVSAPSQVLVFNLDFIPYLGKPTIIISSDPEVANNLKSKITNALKGAVDLIIDNALFAGGSSFNNLREIFPSNKCKVVNLVLSYEFINNYDVLRAFIRSLT
jgi:hypothetical protein